MFQSVATKINTKKQLNNFVPNTIVGCSQKRAQNLLMMPTTIGSPNADGVIVSIIRNSDSAFNKQGIETFCSSYRQPKRSMKKLKIMCLA